MEYLTFKPVEKKRGIENVLIDPEERKEGKRMRKTNGIKIK